MVAGAALVALLVGCGDRTGTPATTTEPTSTVAPADQTAPVVRAYRDPAQPISVARGQQFAIVLDADPTNGASWQPVTPPDPAIVASLGSEFKGPGEAIAGTPDSQVLRFGGRGLGTTQIALRYAPPGATPTPQDKLATFTVTVIDPNAPTTTAPPDTTTTETLAPTTTPRSVAPRATTTKPRTTTTKPRTTTTT